VTLRLDVALIRRYPQLSRRKAQDVISKGQVSLDGQTVQEPGHIVGERAEIAWDPNRKAQRIARIALPLLHADEWLLVVDKPAGLLTVPSGPGASREDTVADRVAAYARKRNPGRPFVGLAHRLDRDTSGALVVALDPAVRQALRALFRAHRIERSYVALVQGQPRGEAGEIDLPIHEGYVSGRRRVARAGEEAMPALTRWRVLERFPAAALLELRLETGRQHQIRVHLAHAGMPVLGDKVYSERSDAKPPRGRVRPTRRAALGGSRHFAAATPDPRRVHAPVPRQMLHARVLGLTHPSTGATVRVESPLPPDFRAVLERLRRSRTR
jgi:23S rRNA pseudouridine1911/1915/1917 synthase